MLKLMDEKESPFGILLMAGFINKIWIKILNLVFGAAPPNTVYPRKRFRPALCGRFSQRDNLSVAAIDIQSWTKVSGQPRKNGITVGKKKRKTIH